MLSTQYVVATWRPFGGRQQSSPSIMKYLSNAVCFVVLVASAALGQQWQPVPDVPFRQLVAARKTFSDAQQVFGWQHLCFTNATSIVTASIQGETVYFAAAKMAVYAYQHSGFCSKVFDIDAGSGSNFVFSSSDSSTLVVLTSQGAQKWSCTSKVKVDVCFDRFSSSLL